MSAGGLVRIRGLSIAFASGDRLTPVVREVDLDVNGSDRLGLIGESGSGKSTLALALMGLLPRNAVVRGRLTLDGIDLATASAAERRRLRGSTVAAVFQDPFTALNPCVTIGRQLAEFHGARLGRARVLREAEETLRRVGVDDPARRLRQYPFELSGGLRQRVLIAAALLAHPRLLIADEPTTALDAVNEAAVMRIFAGLSGAFDGAMIFVTHHLRLVETLCDRVAVIYAGEIVEEGPLRALFDAPRHPYTRALLDCDPERVERAGARLPTIPGHAPAPDRHPSGCAFAPRCARAVNRCRAEPPPRVTEAGRTWACHRPI